MTQSAEFSGSNIEATLLNINSNSQKWTLINNPNGFSWVSSNWNNHYINSPGEINGTSIVVDDFNANWWSMLWEIEPAGCNIIRIKNLWAYRYLDVIAGFDVVVNTLNLNDTNQ